MSTTFLIALYVACELIANITANKPIEILGLSAPGGVFIYALTFTLIDLLNERLGKNAARGVVFSAFAANLLFALYALFVVWLPSPAFFTGQAAFAAVVGSTPRIVGASLTAYLVSSMIDIEVFAFWKRRVGTHAWARVLASNSASTAVDSAVFVLIAFAGTSPVLPLMAGQYVIKMAVTVISVPLIYLAHGAGGVRGGPAKSREEKNS